MLNVSQSILPLKGLGLLSIKNNRAGIVLRPIKAQHNHHGYNHRIPVNHPGKSNAHIIHQTDSVGLTTTQAGQLQQLSTLHARVDKDGTPLWYVPRSWSETQREIVKRLEKITQIEIKMLGIIERLESKLENKN